MTPSEKMTPIGVPIATTPFPISSIALSTNADSVKGLNTLFGHTNSSVFSPLYCKGRTALWSLFESLKIKFPHKNKVIIPAYTGQSIAYASISSGLQINLCDINSQDLLYDLNQLEELTSSNCEEILAVIVPYCWGIGPLSKIKKIHNILRSKKIICIDDFATTQITEQSIIDYFKKNSTFSLFSFGSTKVFSIFNGGIYSYSPELIEKMYQFTFNPIKVNLPKRRFVSKLTLLRWIDLQKVQNKSWYAKNGKFSFQNDMYPENLTIDKYILSTKWSNVLGKNILLYSNRIIIHRERINKYYDEIFSKQGWDLLSKGNANAIGSRYPILCPTQEVRDSLATFFFSKKISVSRGYIHSIPNVQVLSPFLHDSNTKYLSFSGALDIEKRLLTLPNHYFVTKSIIKHICLLLEEYFIKHSN
jgi:dTDP-4-amino-4,6-dideoxygalactose transaminase